MSSPLEESKPAMNEQACKASTINPEVKASPERNTASDTEKRNNSNPANANASGRAAAQLSDYQKQKQVQSSGSLKQGEGKASQSGSKSATAVTKQFSVSSNSHKQPELYPSISQLEPKPASTVRRTTRESKPSSKLQASKEVIQLASARQNSSASSRKDAASNSAKTAKQAAKSGDNVSVGPPKLGQNLSLSVESAYSKEETPAVNSTRLTNITPQNPTPGQAATSLKGQPADFEEDASEAQIRGKQDQEQMDQKARGTSGSSKAVPRRTRAPPQHQAQEADDQTISEDEDDDDVEGADGLEAGEDDEDMDEDEDDDEEDDEEGSDDDAAPTKGRAAGRSKRSKKKQTSRKLWSKSEDDAIVELVKEYGTKKWTFVANKLEEKFKIRTRTGKQCRERWHNHLDPYINKTPINKLEEKKIFDLHKKLGNKWADIAKDLPGRSDNCIKNYFYSTHRKHQRRINKSLRNAQVAKILGLTKNTTAEELHKLVITKKTTYEEIRKIDPVKFIDLESTMRMLYDHGNMTFDSSVGASGSVPPVGPLTTTNASMREPKRASTSTRAPKPAAEKASVGKRKARVEGDAPKHTTQPVKAAKRTPASSETKAPSNPKSRAGQVSAKAKKAQEPEQSQEPEVLVEQSHELVAPENYDDPYTQQQNTPVFHDKDKQELLAKEDNTPQRLEKEILKKRGKKSLLKDQISLSKILAGQQSKQSPGHHQARPSVNLSVTKQDSSDKKKGLHQIPYTKSQPGSLQLGMQPSGGSYKNLGLSMLNRGLIPPSSSSLYSTMGYMPRGFPYHQFHPLQGYGSIDPACHAKYELAWGADYDRLGKVQPVFKAGELPPATPDPAAMFDKGFQPRQIRNPMMPPQDKMFNLSMNSPMFIPILNEASPRPPPTRQHYQAAGQPGAVNFTFNVNVNSDYRPTTNAMPSSTSQSLKPCAQCGVAQCQCNDMASLDHNALSKLFQIDCQKSAMPINLQPNQPSGPPPHLLNQGSMANFGGSSHAANYSLMSQPNSVQDGLANVMPSSKVPSSMMSDLKSELKAGGSSVGGTNKDGFILSALNSDAKPNLPMGHQPLKQSFMTKLSSAAPLVKDVSFGGPQSFGVLSGLPSSGTARQMKETSSVFPATAQSQMAFSTLMGRSVTPRPLNVETQHVTVGAKAIYTPKYKPPPNIPGTYGNEAQGVNNDADVVSHKSLRSQSQRSAFKPLKKRSDQTESRQGQPGAQEPSKGVTQSAQKQVTEPLGEVAQDMAQPSNASNNCLSPEEKQEMQRQINNSATSKEGPASLAQSQ